MPDTARVDINEIVAQFATQEAARNIYGFVGPTKRGPINDASGDPIRSWAQFQKKFGGLSPTNDFPLLCKRALERGAALRISSTGHYTDISNRATLDAVKSVVALSVAITLSAPLAAGHTMQATVNGTPYTQVFTTDSLTTLALFAKKVLAGSPSTVERVKALSDIKLVLVPKAGVVLTVTSAPSGAGAPNGNIGNISTFATSGGNELFRLKPKHPRKDYDNVVIEVMASSNGNANAFDISVTHTEEGDAAKEDYKGLTIVGNPTAGNSNYLDKIVKSSNLLEVEYLDLSGFVGQLNPQPFILRFTGGSDGGALTTVDYIGNETSKTGLRAFDGIDDIGYVAVPNRSDTSINQAIAAYADLRKDIEGHMHLSNAALTEDAVIAERDATGVDSSFARFFAGGIKIADPITGGVKEISEMGDVAGIIASSAEKYGPWISSAGKRRGILTNAQGIVNNFGALSNIINLDRVANRQINTVINRGGTLYLSGNFTAQKGLNALSWANVRGMLLYLRKALYPILEWWLEEPNDFRTWRGMYALGRLTLEELKTKRGIREYSWQGDQFADTMDELTVNTLAEVDEGKYRIKLYVKEIVSLQWIGLDIILTPSGISIEDVLNIEPIDQI